MRKVTKGDINRENMIALGYCQCQAVLNMFAYDNKRGYNSGIYGWNYDLYRVNNTDIVTGYNVPYQSYSNQELKNKLIALENKVRSEKYDEENRRKWLKEFFEIFK